MVQLRSDDWERRASGDLTGGVNEGAPVGRDHPGFLTLLPTITLSSWWFLPGPTINAGAEKSLPADLPIADWVRPEAIIAPKPINTHIVEGGQDELG